MIESAHSLDSEVDSHARPKAPSLPCCMPESSPGRHASLQRVAETLQRIDELGEATGAVIFDGVETSSGAVLIENGRICWAVAAGLKQRMVEILCHQEQSPPSIAQVEEVFKNCQRTGVPLGEALVAQGLVSTSGLRKALRQHTAEAISLLSVTNTTNVRFLKHKNQGYNAQYTFSGAELLCALGALRDVDAAAIAMRRLKDVLPDGASGVVYSRDLGASPIAIGMNATAVLGVAELADISAWASGAIDIGAAVGGSTAVRLVSLSDAQGRSIALWQDGAIMYVAICPDAPALGRVLMGVGCR